MPADLRQIQDMARRLRAVVQVLRENDPANFTEEDLESLAQVLENMAAVMENMSSGSEEEK